MPNDKIKKISDFKELKEIISQNQNYVIVGTGWIGKLVYTGLVKMGGYKNKIDVVKGEEKNMYKMDSSMQ
jgi:hypothetical protein